jgi:hypothetical protein
LYCKHNMNLLQTSLRDLGDQACKMQRDMEPPLCTHLIALFFKEHLKTPIAKVRVTLRLAVYRPSVRLGAKPLEAHDQRFFLQLNFSGYSPYVISFLTRGWVCLLWILFAFVKCTYRTYVYSMFRPRHQHSAPPTFCIVPTSTTPRKGWWNSKAVDFSFGGVRFEHRHEHQLS